VTGFFPLTWVLGIKIRSSKACFQELGVVANTFNPSTQKAEEGGFLSLRPAWSTEFQDSQGYTEKPGLEKEKKACFPLRYFPSPSTILLKESGMLNLVRVLKYKYECTPERASVSVQLR
jgi:predicted RNase H-like nuclease